MICPRCEHLNDEGNAFCTECGAPLAATCPACGTANAPGSNFCGHCGADLRRAEPAAAEPPPAPAPAAPVKEERRLVSVLFADLVGFTPLSESRDAEDVRGLLNTYFDRSRAIIDRFGGTVEKFIGDAVMAVWGAVASHEDDAERAVRAALELVDMVSGLGAEIGVPDLSLRAGVLSGETSVGPGGGDRGWVVGDLVNTAARLQSIAEPRTVLVGEPTMRMARAAVQFEPLGEQRVKGKDEPVAAFRALRVVGELGGRRRGAGLEAPFTGRDVELRLLKDQLHAAAREGTARLVSVVGEAGIGKSRLVWELEKYVDGLARSVYWHRGRSPAYGDNLTLWALGEMVRARAGIAEPDDPGKARLRLRTAVAEYVASEDDRRWLEPRLAALLGLDAAPPGDRDELFAAIRTFFHHIAARGVTVLVFEDLHWADSALVDFVAELVERSPRHPILVVALARPELLDAHPGWGAGRHNVVAMHLGPLGDAAMGELVAGMAPGIPPAAVEAIVAKAAGVPLYAVEFVRMLVSAGELVPDGDGYRLVSELADLGLPDSLQAVVGSRLDRLAPEARQLVQDAAVLGQSFVAEGLAIVRDEDAEELRERLDGLVRLHLLEVDDDPRSPERGQYRFVQSVIREVAYGRLSRRDRYERHLRVAEYFEALEEVELAGVVASHYLAAHEAAPEGEGDELLERARSGLADAAARAAGLQSHAAALGLLAQALELAGSEAERAALHEAAAVSATWVGRVDESIGHAEEAARLYGKLGDEAGRLRAVRWHGYELSSVFRADESVALLAPVYESLDDPVTAEEVTLALETARAYMLNQEPGPAIEISERVLGRAERLLGADEVLDGIVTKATAYVTEGRLLEAIAVLTGAVSLADERNLLPQAIRALNNLSVALHFDEPGRDLEVARELLARTRKLGAPSWVFRAAGLVAAAAVDHGLLDEAEALADEHTTEETPAFEREVLAFTRLRAAMLRTGDPDAIEAARRITTGWLAATDQQMRGLAAEAAGTVDLLARDVEAAAGRLLGEYPVYDAWLPVLVALWLGDRARLERSLELIEETSPGRVGEGLRMLAGAGIAAVDGDPEAPDRFVAALDRWRRIGAPLHVACFQAAFCKVVGGDHPVAARAGAAALAWIREVGAAHLETVLGDGLPGVAEASETA